MKRKLSTAETQQPQQQRGGRRQPLTSCLNCRQKKLKCDRGAPCSSCHIRGLVCSSQPDGGKPTTVGAVASTLPHSDDAVGQHAQASILSRLARLEKAVFANHGNHESVTTLSASASPNEKNNSSVQAITPRNDEAEQDVKFLDTAYNGYDHSVWIRRPVRFRYQVADASLHRGLLSKASVAAREAKHILMMTREQAFLLLGAFIDNPYHMLHVIHEPSICELIDRFYTQLDQGLEGDPVAAALILSISAVSATFYCSLLTSHKIFNNGDDAADIAISWAQTALDVIDPVYCSKSWTLERMQAMTLISFTIVNAEGCQDRFRAVHSYCIAAARNMTLHLIDSPVTGDKSDDEIAKELGRRIWWHITATDWLLSLIGGRVDGTYSIQPRHFNVKLPRNINNRELSKTDGTFDHPRTVPTDMSGFLLRLQLAEQCREISDSRAPGFPDIETADFNTAMALDRRLGTFLEDLPPFLHQDGPIPPGAPKYFSKTRDLLLICTNIRRARIHRPLLLHRAEDPHCEPSRRQCIASAQKSLSIAMNLLEVSSIDGPDQEWPKPFGNLLALRVGLIVSAVFMACAILALDAGLAKNRLLAQGKDPSSQSCDHYARITLAYRALTKAGEKSTYAAYLNRSLTSLLKKYVTRITDEVSESTKQQQSTTRLPNPHPALRGAMSYANSTTMSDATTAVSSVASILNGGYPGAQPPLQQMQQQQQRQQQQQQQMQQMQYNNNNISNINLTNANVGIFDDLEMWNQFFTVMPDYDDYDQIFAGLDLI